MIERHRFGATGVAVHPLCFGTMTLGGAVDQARSFELLDLACDHGVNFIDCANMYTAGESERIVGEWMRQRRNRQRLVLSSKVRYQVGDDPETAGLSPRTVERELERSLERLGTDHVDIYFLHQPDYDTPIEVTLQCIDRLARAGKFRYLGLSNFAAWQIVEADRIAAANGWIRPTVVQTMYNLIARYPEHELLPMTRRYDLGVCNYNPLAGGVLSGKYGTDGEATGGRMASNETYRKRYWDDRQRAAAMRLAGIAAEAGRSAVELAVRFCLDREDISTVILGATSTAQLAENLAAADTPPLAADELAACDRVWQDLSGPVPRYNR